jgi:carotenoid cleavage dioxygenase
VGENYLTRRDLIRRGAYGVLALGAAGTALAACADGSEHTARYPVTATTEPPERPEAWWLEGNFAPVQVESTVTDLTVTGTLPPSLTGLYSRNGSNPLSGRSPHWFLGDGMVHGIALENGRARWYRNRYVQTGFLAAGGGLRATSPGGANSLSNVSTLVFGDRLLSLGEVGGPFELSPTDLSTVGPLSLGAGFRGNFTAHPKLDPGTGKLHAFGYNFTDPYLTYYVLDDKGTLLSSDDATIPAATMMHDFAITARDVVFMDLPVAFDLTAAIKMTEDPSSGIVPFEWKPSLGARLGVMPLEGSTSQLEWIEIEPCYVYHTVNSWRQGNDIKMEVCRLDSTLAPAGTASAATRHLWTISTSGRKLTFTDERLDAPAADLPTIDRRFAGRRTEHSWLGEVVSSPGNVRFVGCQHMNSATGELDRWVPDRGRTSGEWLFVPEGPNEGEGWVLSFLYDPQRNRSSLVVLDAQAVHKGPVAEIELPVRVPYGFHGSFLTA